MEQAHSTTKLKWKQLTEQDRYQIEAISVRDGRDAANSRANRLLKTNDRTGRTLGMTEQLKPATRESKHMATYKSNGSI